MKAPREIASGFGITDVGLKRKKNDDSFVVDASLGLFIVCDGVGGNLAGNVASQVCAATVHEHVRQNAALLERYASKPTAEDRLSIAQMLRKSIEAANVRIRQMADADPAQRGMSTTVDALLLTPDFAFLGHVGDSRIYLIRGAKSHQLTEDHKVSTEMVKQGQWTEEQAAKSPYAHTLTRAVGTQHFVQVDLLQLELAPDDSFLLCSDGLADYLRGFPLAESVRRFELSALPAEFVRHAKERGGHDNITAVVARARGVRAQPAQGGSLAIDALKKSEILGKVPLFRYLTYAELTKVLTSVTMNTYEKGSLLVEEGASSNEMFVIVSGSIEVVKSGHVIATRGRGDFFGEMGLFDVAPRSASVRAAETTTTLALTRKELLTLLRQDSQIAVKFLWALNQEINQRLRITSQDLAFAKASLEAKQQQGAELPFTVSAAGGLVEEEFPPLND